MTDKTDEAVAWILQGELGGRLWTRDRAEAKRKAGEWESPAEPLFPASSLASRDARIAELEALLEEAVKGLEGVRALSSPGIRFERPRHNLDAVSDLARATLTAIKGGE